MRSTLTEQTYGLLRETVNNMIDPGTQKNVRIKVLFVALFFMIAAGMNIAVSIYVSQWRGLFAIVYLALVQIVNLGIAYELTGWILAFVVKKRDLPKLSSLKRYPPVAVLYLTRNDFMPALASRLKALTYPNPAIFVLDDSTQIEYRHAIDRCGLPVVRREIQTDYKAGNLNHWLRHHGHDFDYFIVLDNDSLIPNNFVEEMVKYAEHDANQDVAIFQSSVGFWNQDNRFARTLDLMRPMQVFLSERIDNPCESIFPTTNMLLRTSVIQDVGGWGTRSLTEDYETGVRVIEHGYRCQRVDVLSYKSTSTSARMHTERMTRWAGGILGIVKSGVKNVPLTTHLRLIMGVYSYLIWPIYIVGMLLAIWSYSSTWGDLRILARLAWHGYLWRSPFVYPALLIFAYFAYFFILRPFLAYRMGISLCAYIGYGLITSATNFYALAPLLKAQILVLLGKRPKWKVLHPEPAVVTFRGVLTEMRLSMFVLGTILVGLVRNPHAIVFNFLWLIPLFLSPFTLYLWQRPTVQRHPEGVL
jgi:cellulose synthase/poly-beta-1,6-N-acetylglucosamine synthase-like glycosyltransferase